MSTRANIRVDDYRFAEDRGGPESLWYYRHGDGYPMGALPPLLKYLDWVQRGLLRENVGQSSGWLIILGCINSLDRAEQSGLQGFLKRGLDENGEPQDWKVGDIEPTLGRHGDIEFLYVIDLTDKCIYCYKAGIGDEEDELFCTIKDPNTDPEEIENLAYPPEEDEELEDVEPGT